MALPHLAFDHFHRRVASCHLILLDGHPFLGLYSILFCPPYFVFIFLEYPARSALRPQRIHVFDLYEPRLPGHDWLWDWELLLLVADCHGDIPHVIVAGMFDSGLDDRQIGGWWLVVCDAVHDKLNSYIITTRFTPHDYQINNGKPCVKWDIRAYWLALPLCPPTSVVLYQKTAIILISLLQSFMSLQQRRKSIIFHTPDKTTYRISITNIIDQFKDKLSLNTRSNSNPKAPRLEKLSLLQVKKLQALHQDTQKPGRPRSSLHNLLEGYHRNCCENIEDTQGHISEERMELFREGQYYRSRDRARGAGVKKTSDESLKQYFKGGDPTPAVTSANQDMRGSQLTPQTQTKRTKSFTSKSLTSKDWRNLRTDSNTLGLQTNPSLA